MDKLFLFESEKEEILEVVELSREKGNEYKYFSLQWDKTQTAYTVRLNQEGKQQKDTYQIDDLVPITFDSSNLLYHGSFIHRETGVSKIYLHLQEHRYLLLRKLDGQTSRQVWLGIDTRSYNRFVALKLRNEKSGHYKRFKRSIFFLISNNISPYFPVLMDVGDFALLGRGNQCFGNYTYQSFEYFPGKPLTKLRKKLPLNKEYAIKIFHEVAMAISDLHAAGLVHRNLKPEHILVNEHGRVKVVGLTLVVNAGSSSTPVTSGIVLSGRDTLSSVSSESQSSLPNVTINFEGTMLGEVVGNIEFIPSSLVGQRRDVYAIASIFLYCIQKTEKLRKDFLNIANAEKLTDEHRSFLDSILCDLPHSLKDILVRILVKREPVAISEIVDEFAKDLGYYCHQITRKDQVWMPRNFNIPGVEIEVWYQPLEELGGDFYNFMELDKNKYCIFVGDMVGHGMKASLYTQLIYPIAQLLTEQHVIPSEIMKKMDILLYDSGKGFSKVSYATALYGILSLNQYNPYFMYTNAGHPFPILYRKEGTQSTASFIKLDNSLFGGNYLGSGRYNYLEKFVSLRAEDILVFYTDGVTETKNKKEEEYGTDRLLKAVLNIASRPENVSMKDMVGELRKQIEDFRQGSKEERDDITLIAIRIL